MGYLCALGWNLEVIMWMTCSLLDRTTQESCLRGCHIWNYVCHLEDKLPQGVDDTSAYHLDEQPIMDYIIGERRVDVELHVVVARHSPTQIIYGTKNSLSTYKHKLEVVDGMLVACNQYLWSTTKSAKEKIGWQSLIGWMINYELDGEESRWQVVCKHKDSNIHLLKPCIGQ